MNQGLTALAHRDQAQAELDRGDAGPARTIASWALVLLETAGQGESPDAAALLVALAETDECRGRFDLARVAAGRAAAILAAFDPEDLDAFWLWCQAEERLAGLDRVGGDLDGAAARAAGAEDRAMPPSRIRDRRYHPRRAGRGRTRAAPRAGRAAGRQGETRHQCGAGPGRARRRAGSTGHR
jgi:hypothetical protein